ncbi:hypothetical protein YB2330_001407 [Saitoella coloradoensis]
MKSSSDKSVSFAPVKQSVKRSSIADEDVATPARAKRPRNVAEPETPADSDDDFADARATPFASRTPAMTRTPASRLRKSTLPAVNDTPVLKNSGHVKFGDDDLIGGSDEDFATADEADSPVKQVAGEQDEESEEESDSDDEAPEAVSMSTGRMEAIEKEREAQEAAKLLEQRSKDKRRQRDLKAKEQKEAAKQRKLAALIAAASKAEEEVEEEADEEDDAALPDLLPDDVLEAAAAAPAPIHKRLADFDDDFEGEFDAPSGSKATSQKQRKKKFKSGAIAVKVLEKQNKGLPPVKAKKLSNMRDQLLQRNGERKAYRKGFRS